MGRTRIAVACALLLLAGCDGPQSALDPAGRQASEILDLFRLLLIGAAVIWLAVMLLLALALLGGPSPTSLAHAVVWLGGIVVPTVVLAALLVYALPMLPRLRAETGNGLRVEISAEQYWWRVTYRAPWLPQPVTSANELRLPVGERVEVLLTSRDVIHSFWIPALAGKIDAIPGRTNRLVLEPTRAGRYNGVCAELCGESHAFMGFAAEVMEADAFRTFLARESGEARPPLTEQQRDGQRLFLAAGCGACHSVRGSEARGSIGPDLTHFGGRRTLGAGVFPMNRGSIVAFVANAPEVKPGSRMPSFAALSGPELNALAAYLEGLE
jgi:cytochrome c oxidase subunit 2